MGLVAFDFDSTLVDAEMIDQLGRQAGVADEMVELTERAMADEIDYAESLRERVGLLTGMDGEAVARAIDTIELRPGAADLLTDLAAADVRTAVITGAFERGVQRILETADVSVDALVANQLEVADHQLTGSVSGPLVEGTKDVALAAIASEFDVRLADTVAVGDGANDRAMLETAGIGIGFSPQPAIADACDVTVESMDALREELVRRQYLA